MQIVQWWESRDYNLDIKNNVRLHISGNVLKYGTLVWDACGGKLSLSFGQVPNLLQSASCKLNSKRIMAIDFESVTPDPLTCMKIAKCNKVWEIRDDIERDQWMSRDVWSSHVEGGNPHSALKRGSDEETSSKVEDQLIFRGRLSDAKSRRMAHCCWKKENGHVNQISPPERW